MIFNLPYNRIHQEIPVYDKSDIVDRTGYKTLQQQIQELIHSGQQLKDMQRFQYHYPDGVIPEGAEPDPTQYFDFDLTVAKARLQQLARKAQEASLERDQLLSQPTGEQDQNTGGKTVSTKTETGTPPKGTSGE